MSKKVNRMIDDLERQLEENNQELSKLLRDNKIRAEYEKKEFEKSKKEFEDSLKYKMFTDFLLPVVLVFALLGLLIFSVLR